MNIPSRYLFLVAVSVIMAGCASAPTKERYPGDPFERVNRVTYRFNNALDRAVLRPTAKAYRAVAPQFVETGVSNFFDNLSSPTVLLNDLLQGKFRAALHDTGRFLLNTTVGLGGLFDPASAAGLEKNDEDFGQTLGKWGLNSGPYLILPFLGPSTIRDGFGNIVDQFSDPTIYIEEDKVRWPLKAIGLIDTRARLLSVDGALQEAYDPYAFLRAAFLQRREYQVTDGAVSEEELLEE
jgi:phospholipid-binding lipoprotein MlaA